jgi:bifunctional DNase/RNase
MVPVTITGVAVKQGDGTQVDARPSDAINLAVVTGAQVFVASELLEHEARPRERSF